MKDEAEDFVPCSSLAVESVLRAAAAGAIWGLCVGPYGGRKEGLTGLAHASHVAKAIGRCGFDCGLFGGVFTITRCGLERYRGQADWVNSVVAAAAGATLVFWMPHGARAVGTAAIVSAFSVAAVYSDRS